MKIITYNVNGIRAALRKDFDKWLKAANPDIVCLQETKALPDQFDISAFEDLGYHFFLFPAEKKGYSGVALLSKEEPKHVEYGMGIDKYDSEGRTLRADFDDFSVMSVYMPSGASKYERQLFKLDWLGDFQDHVNDLSREGKELIIGGDFNICHQPIDIHDPFGLDGYPGFTEEERSWITSFLNEGFIDSFRHLNKEPHNYSWWSYRAGARPKNLGWRIDYLILSQKLESRLSKARHLTEAYHSDHCPVFIEMKNEE